MSGLIEVFSEVIQKLEIQKINYLIVGSIASMVYGEPRLTRDMDVVLDIKSDDAQKFETLFQQPNYYCPPYEVLSDEIRNRGQFNLLHVSSGLKIDIMIKKTTAFDQSRFDRVQKIELWPGLFAKLASAEDIIIKKLEFYREGGSEKHLRDIRGIQTNTELDEAYLNEWISKLHLEKEWTQV